MLHSNAMGGDDMDMWQTMTAGGPPPQWIQTRFDHYDGDPDREQYVASWRDHYVDGDPRKGFVTEETADAA